MSELSLLSNGQLKTIAQGNLQQFYDEKTLTIAVNDRVEVFTNFNYFRILSMTAGGSLGVVFGDNLYETPFTGAGLGLKVEYVLPRFTLVNRGATPLVLTYAVAIGNISDDRLNVSGTVTVAGSVSTTTSSTLLSIADVTATAATLTAIAAANLTRRGLIITNSGANVARVGDSVNTNATTGAPLYPNQSITLETLNAVSGYSTLGTTFSVVEY